MKAILQWWTTSGRDRAAAALLDAVATGATPELATLYADTWRRHGGGRGHFGLTFALGQVAECVAAGLPWDDRTEWYARAVAGFEAAIDQARRNDVAGHHLIAAASPNAWPGVPSAERRSLLAALFHAGLLQVAEFRVRDVSRAIQHLRFVADAVEGYHPAWYYLGEAFTLAGRFDEAERAWREGLRRSPNESAIQTLLANLPVDRVHFFQKQGDWTAVLRALERLPASAMPIAERLTIEGDARQALDDDAGARDCWERALAADSSAVGVRRRVRRLPIERVL